MSTPDQGDSIADAITRYAESVRDIAGDCSVADVLSPPIDLDYQIDRFFIGEGYANEERARRRFLANAEWSDG